MILILDEWIIHDLQNDNGMDKQKESFQFLQKIKEKCDEIALVEGSKFTEKLWDFSKKASQIIEFKAKFGFLKGSFIYNSKKTKIINLQDIESKNYDDILKDVNRDDHYLVLCYEYLKQKGKETIIITTDKNLKRTLEQKGISIELRDEFLKKYTIK